MTDLSFVRKDLRRSRQVLVLSHASYSFKFLGCKMHKGILQALFMLAGGLLLVTVIAVTAALLAARINTSTLAASLAPAVARAADDVLETPDVMVGVDSPVNVIASNTNHRNVVFEHSSSYGGSWDVFLADGQTGQVHQLTTHPATDQFPVLSPDGNSIAFVTWRDGNSEFYVIEGEDGALHNVSNHPAHDTLPVWSPDSSMLAFVSDRDGNGEIYLADINRGLIQNLTHMVSHDSNPQWTTDGTWIMFSAYGTLGWDDFQMSIDGHRSVVVASHPYPSGTSR